MLSRRLPGEASPAAAGILAPGVAPLGGAAEQLARVARDGYTTFLDAIHEESGIRVPHALEGVLEVVADDAAADQRQRALGVGERWLSPRELMSLEPGVTNVAGAVFHERDGWVDNAALLAALEAIARAREGITIVEALADELSLSGAAPAVTTARGERFEGDIVVLAAGAWSPWLRGLPGALPVEPVRGQMLALTGRHIRHPIVAEHIYLTPRVTETLAGSTLERVGLEVGTTPEVLEGFRRAASVLVPSLAGAPPARAWSGLRPMSPDLVPLVGPHPADGRLLVACGHSRNGVLLAPLTGECVARLACGEEPEWDITPFSLQRFA